MNKTLGIVVGIFVLVAIGIFTLAGEKPETQTMVAVVDEQTETMEPTMIDEQPATDTGMVVTSAGSYEPYAAEKIAMAATGDVVLFFHASWCPTCRALSSDIEANTAAIPAGVTILKTDYDAETDLKKKYGVTTQHTLVQVDEEGALIKKWSGGSKLENLLSQIQ